MELSSTPNPEKSLKSSDIDISQIAAKHKLKALEKELAVKNQTQDRPISTAVDEEVIQFVQEKSFSELGVCPEICGAVEKMGYKHPSKI
jgi:hypothetical protein